MRWVFFLVLGLVWSAAAAQQREAWTCAYLGFGSPPEPIIARYVIEGKELHDADNYSKFSVIANNDRGIVAAYSFSNDAHPTQVINVSASIILIDRKTGEFSRAFTSTDTTQNRARKGKCLKD